jgi:predicted DCC family thiol-disulfide oxidoreductase YuxK
MNDTPLILFDGVCNLCNSSVQFVIKRDLQKKFHFASLQSECAKEILSSFHKDTANLNSFILVQKGKVYTHSTAALKVASQLSGPIQLMYVFIIIPPFLRNVVYNFIAARRYRWFGKKETCMVPDEFVKQRFLC